MSLPRLLLAASVIAFAGCRTEEDLDHCVDPAACDAVAAYYGIRPAPGAERESRIVHVDGQEMHLVEIEYGLGMDCSAGCFFDVACALYDPATGSVDLVGFDTYSRVSEGPPGLASLCTLADPNDVPFQSQPSTCDLSGYTPALLAAPEVQPLLANSPPYLRFCSYFLKSYARLP